MQVVGLQPLQIVLTGTVMEISCFLAQIPTCIIADLYSRKRSVVLGQLLMGSGLLFMGGVPTFAAGLIGHAIWGVGAVCVDGALEAWAAEEIGESRMGLAFARQGQITQAGGIVGVLAAVALSSVSLAAPTVVAGVVVLLLAAFLAVGMPERHFVRPIGDAGPARSVVVRHLRAVRTQFAAGRRQVRDSRVLRMLLVGALFVGLSSEGVDRLSQPHLLADLHFPTDPAPAFWFGGFAIGAMLGSIGLTELIRRRIDRLDARGISRWLGGLTAARVAEADRR